MGAVAVERKLELPLTGNMLKVIAAVAMTIDHLGMLIFPGVPVLRYIGRIAMPIFAFMIAEGCIYTRDRLRYFLSVFLLGVVCQTVYTVATGDWLFCVPFTFSVSILLNFSLDAAIKKKGLWISLPIIGIAATYWLSTRIHLDYGFWGCMLAVFAAAPMQFGIKSKVVAVAAMCAPMVLLIGTLGAWQIYSLVAVPLLLLYNGKRGKAKMKYFFYIFYPLHLAALQGISWLLWLLQNR